MPVSLPYRGNAGRKSIFLSLLFFCQISLFFISSQPQDLIHLPQEAAAVVADASRPADDFELGR